MLTEAGGSKKRKGEFASNIDKNSCKLALLQLQVVNMPRPLCFVCFQIYQTMQWNLPNMLVRNHFHSKHSNLQGKPKTIQRDE